MSITKNIRVWDQGTSSSATLTEQGLTVTETGGCPVEKILGQLDPTLSNEELEEVVVERWSNGYDGDVDTIRVSVEDAD